MAGVQVQEALKLLDPEKWEGRTLAGREFIFNGTVGDASVVESPVRADCPAHNTLDTRQILSLPEMSVSKTTVAQLLKRVRAELGRRAVVELNFELAVEVKCWQCQTVRKIWRPRVALFSEDTLCPQCHAEGQLLTTHTLGQSGKKYSHNFARATLEQIGVPPLDLLAARGAGEREIYLELTGDLELYSLSDSDATAHG